MIIRLLIYAGAACGFLLLLATILFAWFMHAANRMLAHEDAEREEYWTVPDAARRWEGQ